MKVTSVHPGTVVPMQGGFRYTIYVNGGLLDDRFFSDPIKSASEAKQKMREEVAFLRKKHCL